MKFHKNLSLNPQKKKEIPKNRSILTMFMKFGKILQKYRYFQNSKFSKIKISNIKISKIENDQKFYIFKILYFQNSRFSKN